MSKLPALRTEAAQVAPAWRALGALLLALRSYPQIAPAPYADIPRRREPDASPETARGDPDVLVPLFAGHAQVATTSVERALGRVGLDALVSSGFVRREGAQLTARFQIQRWGDVLLACDWPEHHEEAEYVHGVTNAGRTLAYITPRRTVDRALDLGTGCGLQAVLAARHAGHVVATDVNARALALTTVSAGLNDADNIEVRAGSWFDPVAGDSFDLVVANPPYVISPEHHLLYRDSGEGDELCGWLLSGLSALLRADGIAVMLVNWARRNGETWSDTPARWLGALDATSVAIKFVALSPREYARRFNLTLAGAPDRYSAAVESWLAYYERLGIDELVLGAVAMTSRTPGSAGARWWPVAAAREASGPGGEQLARMLAGSVQANRSSGSGRQVVPELVIGHELWQRLRFVDGAHVADNVRMVFPDGIGVEAEIAPEVLAVVLAIDGTRDVDAIVRDLHDADALAPEITVDVATSVVFDLVRAGLVELRDPPG